VEEDGDQGAAFDEEAHHHCRRVDAGEDVDREEERAIRGRGLDRLANHEELQGDDREL
jgi:hypothetical protein